MIKTKKLLSLFISTFMIFTICTAEEAQIETTDSEIVETPSIPANILFVTELQTYLDNNDIDGAIKLFDLLPEDLANDLELKSLEASLCYSNKNFDRAIKVCNEILKVDNTRIDAAEILALCYKAKNNTKEYNRIANEILKKDIYNPTINIEKANEYVLAKRWNNAKNYYANALKGDPQNIEAMFGFAKMSYYLDDVKTAERYLNAILKIDPYDAEALAYLGTIEFDKEEFQNASEYVEKALKIDPYNYSNWIDYGNYLRHQGKLDEAIKAWECAVKIDPSYFLAYENLAGVYDQKGMTDKALENYHKVVETNPDYFYAFETIAILEYHKENYREAIKYFQKAQNAYDNNPLYANSKNYSYSLMTAVCYFKLKDNFNARRVLEAQMKKMDRNSTEYDLLRFFHDSYSRNAENSLLKKIDAEKNNDARGKMLFYMGLYYEINGSETVAKEYYAKVTEMQAPMFFEYRIAEWGLKK